MTSVPAEFLIVFGTAAVVAFAISFLRARKKARHQLPDVHRALIQRAEGYAAQSPFLSKICREYEANGHISKRQADAVAKAIARIDARRQTEGRPA